MIDVLLSLLIIFMVASPPPPNQKQPINLPQDTPVQQPDDPEATLVLRVATDNTVKVGEAQYPTRGEPLIEALKASEKAQSDGRVAVTADAGVAYGEVIAVMAAARQAGIDSVGVAHERL